VKGQHLIELGGAMLFVAFIIFLLPGIHVGVVDTGVITSIAFFGLAILGFILVGVGSRMRKNETKRD